MFAIMGSSKGAADLTAPAGGSPHELYVGSTVDRLGREFIHSRRSDFLSDVRYRQPADTLIITYRATEAGSVTFPNVF
jgi:hypothetical protein